MSERLYMVCIDVAPINQLHLPHGEIRLRNRNTATSAGRYVFTIREAASFLVC